MYDDKNLVCKDCNEEFTFTANEQEFYASKGFENEPGRCPECRSARKQQRSGSGSGGGGYQRESHSAVCADCGAETTVPFKPSGDRPVYCRDCFSARKPARW